jgi:hypothetical protein
MKTNIFLVFFIVCLAGSAYCRGKLELVNTQEITLDQINVINVSFRDDNVYLLKGTSDRLIIMEYMSEDKNEYYARINKSGNTVTVEMGSRPFGLFFNFFGDRVEIYLPESYFGAVNIKTTDGRIDVPNGFSGVNLQFETRDGNITVNAVSAELISLKSTDGNISFTITNEFENISIVSRDGKVRLDLPRNSVFKFSARTRDGRLSTPFADRLSNPVNDRRLTEGIVGNGNIPVNKSVSINTSDGSISVNWL